MIAAPPAGRSITTFDVMDALRALAALAVLFSHERNLLFLDATPDLSPLWHCFYFVTGFGHTPVILFFVLSGYWITKSVARRSLDGGFAWSDYAIDRLCRLWIVLIPALLIGGGLDMIGRYGTAAPLYFGIQGTSALTWDVATRLSPGNLAGNLVFLQTLVATPFGSNGPLWSLANEFWYYVWFPPLYQLVRKRRPSIAASLIVVITMVAFRNLLPGFICWLCGSLLCFATRTPFVPTARPHRMRIARSASAIAFVGVLCLARVKLPIDGAITDLAVSLSFALFLFTLIRSEQTHPNWLAPLCRYGARASYSLYVVHFPLIVLLAALFVTPAHRLPPSAGLLLTFAVIGIAAIGYGYGVSALTEAHTAKLRRWLKDKFLRTDDTRASVRR